MLFHVRTHFAHCRMFHLCKNLMSKLLCPVKLVNLHIISLQGFCECRRNLNQLIQHTASNRCLQKKSVKKWDKSLQLLDSLCMGKLLLMLQKTAQPPPRHTQLKPLQQKHLSTMKHISNFGWTFVCCIVLTCSMARNQEDAVRLSLIN